MNKRWKIFYSDYSTYCDADGPIEEAPKAGVVAICTEHDVTGRKIDRSMDYYVLADYGWRGVDQFGLYDYLIQPGWKLVLCGRTVEDSVWAKIWGMAADDDYLPPRSSITKEEKKLRPSEDG